MEVKEEEMMQDKNRSPQKKGWMSYIQRTDLHEAFRHRAIVHTQL